jgi:dihydroneopterin aldolase
MINTTPIVTVGRFQLQVCRYRLWLCIGCTEEERAKPQPIDVDVSIRLNNPPTGAQTDNLEDTFCYQRLLEGLKDMAQSTTFHLLERLATVLVEYIDQYLGVKGYRGFVAIGVTKVCPPIPSVLGGIRICADNGYNDAETG